MSRETMGQEFATIPRIKCCTPSHSNRQKGQTIIELSIIKSPLNNVLFYLMNLSDFLNL